MVDFLFEFEDPQTGCSVVIDDDGRVAYAYLRDPDQEIIGDVWLYNRAATPAKPDWDHRTVEPFLNPFDFVRTDIEIALPDGATDFSIGWNLDNPSDPNVIIYLRDQVWAILAPGATPGFCKLAALDGPLARVLP
jgi:hypothetical protein